MKGICVEGLCVLCVLCVVCVVCVVCVCRVLCMVRGRFQKGQQESQSTWNFTINLDKLDQSTSSFHEASLTSLTSRVQHLPRNPQIHLLTESLNLHNTHNTHTTTQPNTTNKTHTTHTAHTTHNTQYTQTHSPHKGLDSPRPALSPYTTHDTHTQHTQHTQHTTHTTHTIPPHRSPSLFISSIVHLLHLHLLHCPPPSFFISSSFLLHSSWVANKTKEPSPMKPSTTSPIMKLLTTTLAVFGALLLLQTPGLMARGQYVEVFIL